MGKMVNYLSTTLFDSTAAHFKLTVESRLTRTRQTDGSLENLCYVNPKGSMSINPNIYLVLTYRGEREETKSLYTSYPQLFRIREALENMKNLLLSEETYTDVEGLLEVAPQYKAPIVLTNIGKDQKWISFGLVSVTNDTDTNRERGVAIQISGQNDLTSVLSMDEFLTIYTIIHDIDLAAIQIQIGLFAVLNDDGAAPMMNNYGGGYYQQAPQQGYNRGGYVPRSTNNYQPAAPRAAAAPSYNSQPRTPSVRNTSGYGQAPVNNYQPTPAPTNPAMPPRNSQPIVNMQAVEETPVDTTDWNDESALNAFFGDSN